MNKDTNTSGIYVIDTSSILSGKTIYTNENMFVTAPGVSSEISPGGKDYQKFELLKETGLKIVSPTSDSINKIKKIAKKTGDYDRLSSTDIEVLAISLDLKNDNKFPIILSDDYSIQNVAEFIGIKYQNISQKKISKKFIWLSRCTGCGKKFKEHINVCPICGSKIKKIIGKKSEINRKK